MSTDEEFEEHHGVLQSTIDLFVKSLRAVSELVAQAGTAGARAVVPEPVLVPVSRLLASLRTLVDEAPQITDELDVLVNEIHAKRLSIQALQAELTVLDDQLEILEHALVPVQAWSTQWNRFQHALLHSIDLPETLPEAPPD